MVSRAHCAARIVIASIWASIGGFGFRVRSLLQARAEPVQRRRFLTGLGLGLLGSILFSGKAIIVKLAYRHGVDAVVLIALRMCVALPFFVAVAWWQSRIVASTKQPSRWLPGDGWRVIGLGLTGYYAASYLDFLGLQYISAALERVILYLNPTMVLLLSVALGGKRPSPRELIALAVAYAGVLVVFGHDLMTVPLARSDGGLGGGLDGEFKAVMIGAALVISSAFSYAIYLVAGGQLVARVGSLRLTAWASIVASIACIGQALLISPETLWTQATQVYWLSLLNGTACTVLPVFLVMMAIERLGSRVASQIGMIGPVSTIVMAALILDEGIGVAQLAGTGVVLVAVWMLSRSR